MNPHAQRRRHQGDREVVTAMKAKLLALWLALGLVSCERSYDPCPTGMVKSISERRCVERSGSIGSPSGDAGPNVSGIDGATPMTTDSSDGSSPADSDAGNPGDAGASDATVEECNEAAVKAWRDFHLSGRLLSTIGQCSAKDPGCASDSCHLDPCIADSAGAVACDTCVGAEISCVAQACVGPCSASGDDAACRACACRNKCVELFDACAGSRLNVCVDCDEGTCGEMSVLPPELILVILQPIVTGPVLMP